MTAPNKIWATEDAENFGEDKFHTAHGPMKGLTEYTRTDLAQAAVAAAYEAAAQVAIGRKGFGSDAALVHPYDKGYVAACDAMATAIRALATPDQIAALAAERAATVVVNPLVWVQSHLTSWNDDWHTIPTAYTIRCCDENGWKWQGNGGHGYESSAKHAMTAVQGIHEAAIRSAITITSGTDSAKMHKAVEALRFYADKANWCARIAVNGPGDVDLQDPVMLGDDHGKTARAVLAEIGGA